MTNITPILQQMFSDLIAARGSAARIEEACQFNDGVLGEELETLVDSIENTMELVLGLIGMPDDPVVREEFWIRFHSLVESSDCDLSDEFFVLAITVIKEHEQKQK
jgi:hypothetical protein